jgi:thiol:disulfide interchange protein DsbD
MGALSALVVTACVAPPLVAALAVVAETGDTLRGGLALFALSLGMGLPLIVIGTSAGKLLPKAGAWMDAIKGTFGFLLLGLAVWMLDRILPGEITMGLWALLVFMAGVFLGAFRPLTELSGSSRKLGKGFGLLAVLYGATLLVGALTGAQNPLQPLQRISGTSAPAAELQFKRIKSVSDLENELQLAAGSERTVMLDFYADWCVSCKEMEHFTFSDPAVQAALSATVLLQADVTANDAVDQALMRRFGIFGPPTIVFFDQQGTEVRAGRVIGYLPSDEFLVHLQTVMN